MEKPTVLSFTDFEIPTDRLVQSQFSGPINPKWTRVQFKISDAYEACQRVEEWLKNNCPGRWSAYAYSDPKSRNYESIMVVRFEDKNDAIMFKLRDGHQSWQV